MPGKQFFRCDRVRRREQFLLEFGDLFTSSGFFAGTLKSRSVNLRQIGPCWQGSRTITCRIGTGARGVPEVVDRDETSLPGEIRGAEAVGGAWVSGSSYCGFGYTGSGEWVSTLPQDFGSTNRCLRLGNHWPLGGKVRPSVPGGMLVANASGGARLA